MANPFKKATNPQGDSSNSVLTAQQFLGKTESKGYFLPAKFLVYGESLRDQEVEYLRTLYSCTTIGLRLDGKTQQRLDRGGRTYMYPSFLKARGTVPVKLILEEGMEEFINDYMDGKFITNFTLDELIIEAQKD